MYKALGVLTAKNGMTREAVAAAKAMVEHINSKYNLQYEAYMQVFGGTAGTIYLMGSYKDMDSLQAAQAKFMADDKFWTLAHKAADVTIEPPTLALLKPIE